MKHNPAISSFWKAPLRELEQMLGTVPTGLSSTEAARRLATYGRNEVERRQRFSLFRKIFSRFRNPLVLILLAAAAISAITGELASFIIITVIVLLSVILDAVQEFRAEQAADRLQASVSLRERVLRDGKEAVISTRDLVPGDVVLLSAGDLVPADGRVIDATDFFVNQSLLTGEAYPVEKHAIEEGVASDEIAEATNAAFMGTSVVSGMAKLMICNTGLRTQLGDISASLRHAPPPAALERGTYQFGLLIVRITALLVLLSLLINLVMHRSLLESFLFSLALAVGLTPELLPMIVSVTLAEGAVRMSREHVIVKRLAAIHDFGSMDVLCTDKTGTLTEAKMRVARTITLSEAESDRVLMLAGLNSYFESGLKSPLDTAILEHPVSSVESWTKIDEIPFDFERRRVSVLLSAGNRRLIVAKGAPEDILRLCDRYEEEGEARILALDAAAGIRAKSLFEAFSTEGYRLLGVAWREVPSDHGHAVFEDESQLIFAGFVAFFDPPKVTAGDAINALARAGVGVKIVTGDNELVARHVCKEVGLNVNGLMTGTEISTLSDDALSARVEVTDLFCRVTPSQKNRIILALKRRGRVVGYMGDGINDAPALHTADVGISVDSAVDIAKDAADIILLKNDLRVLERGIYEGRRTFGNIMKYVMMATSSNFGNMFSMAAATLLLPFLPMMPVQVLLNNLLYDLSEIPIPLDEIDEEMIAAPCRWDINFIRNFMLVLGPISSLFDLLTFGVLLFVFHADEKLFQTGWFLESLATQVLVIFVIRTRRNPLRSRPSRILVATSLGVIALALALPYVAVGRWFGLTPPPAAFLLATALMVGCYLLLVEVVKRWFYRLNPPAGIAHAAVLRSHWPLLPR